MATLAKLIDDLNRVVGNGVAWVALAIVLVQFAVVVMRYVFGIGFVAVQESIIYMHALLFMAGAGCTLLRGGHVRVDIFYRDASRRTRAVVDIAGSLLLLAPVCVLIWRYAWPYVGRAWAVHEGSKETSGLQLVFLLKTLLLVFSALVLAQGIAMAIHAARVLLGAEGPSVADEASLPAGSR